MAIPVAAQMAAHRVVSLLLPLPVIAMTARLAHAKLFMTQDEALAKAFPKAAIERRTAYLAPEQVARIQKASRTKVESVVQTYYVASKDGQRLGTAYFDTRLVRTLPMTLMVTVKTDSTIGAVDVLSFYEPEDYLPRLKWLNTFLGRSLADRLRLRFDIPNVTGATLSCHAISDGVRQILALHKELNPSL